MIPMIKKWKVCECFGIPLYVDVTFIALAVMCMLSSGSIIGGLLGAVLLAFSIVAHELGHSLTARKFGCPTRLIVLSVLGGCAALEKLPRSPKQELLVAVAGPAVSFALGVIGIACGAMASFIVLNFCLGLFNLLPGFPMDGGRVLRAALQMKLPRVKATWWAMRVGRVVACILGGLGFIALLHGGVNGLMLMLIAWFIWKAGHQEYIAVSCYGA